MDNDNLNLPREEYEPVVSQPVELEFMDAEIILSVFDIHDDHEIRACYGDIYKIVNALRDYSQLLTMVCSTWDLQGFHQATYEYHAEKLREVADKFQTGIGYDYDAAVEKCRKRKEKKQRDEDAGGEALALGFVRAQQKAEAIARKAAEQQGKGAATSAANTEAPVDDPWEEDF